MTNINHPKHYNLHPSTIECVDIAEQFIFNLGNAIKYIWRTDHKENDIIDLEKSKWYIHRELIRRNNKNDNFTNNIVDFFRSIQRRNNKELKILVEKWIRYEPNELVRPIMRYLYDAHCKENDTFSLVIAYNILDLEIARRISTTTLDI